VQGRDVVLYEDMQSRSMISGVPHFIIMAPGSEDVHLSGGLPASMFLRNFQKLLARLPK
jgi:hypothetical protein